MRFLLIFFLSLSAHLVSARDTLGKGLTHSVGFGYMTMAGRNTLNGHYASKLHYDQPGLYGFYKIILPAEGTFHMAMYVNACSRSGNWYRADGSLAGSNSEKGNFSLVRADLGVSGVFVNSRGNSFFDIGLYAGGLLNATGKAKVDESYMGSGKSTEKNAASELSGTMFGINIEFSRHFKVAKRNYILVGIRLRIETPEADEMPLGKMAGIHLGYAFK